MAKKKFVVCVVRICPQYLHIEVEAASEREAKKKALALAYDRDFRDEGTSGEAEYRAEEIERADNARAHKS